jgi:hypothetical protein
LSAKLENGPLRGHGRQFRSEDRLIGESECACGSSPPLPEGLRPRILPEERPTSAILLNRSAKSIAGLQVVWRFESETGRTFRHSHGILSPKTLLLPFYQQNDSIAKLNNYWQTIFPGSKRYIAESGLVGDNTDVRPPSDDAKWRGGTIGGRGGGGGSSREPIRQVTLVLDGVFFLDGEFVGPEGSIAADPTRFEKPAAHPAILVERRVTGK